MVLKNRMITILSLIFLSILVFYIWRASPLLPHIDRNNDGTFTFKGITYIEYSEPDFIEKFEHLKRGKKLAIISKQKDQPWSTIYEAQGSNSKNTLIVHEETIMSIDTYYIAK